MEINIMLTFSRKNNYNNRWK